MFQVAITHCWKMDGRRKRVQSTWLGDCVIHGIPAFFFVGAHTARKPERHGDMVVLPAADEYHWLPFKVRQMCSYALSLSWDYLVKVDDDCRVSVPRLAKYIDGLQGVDYIGVPVEEHHRCCSFQPHGHVKLKGPFDASIAYASGPCYILSRKAATILARSMEPEIGAEDMIAGRTLRAAGIYLTPEQQKIKVLSEYGDEPGPGNSWFVASPKTRNNS